MKNLTTTSATLAFLALALPATAQVGGDTTPPVFTSQVTVTPNPNPAAPLTAVLHVTTDEPTKIDINIQEATRSWRVTPSRTFSTTHDLPLIGFRPDRPHRIQLSVRDASNNRAKWTGPLSFTTPPLPANFPPLSVVASSPERMEPGVTLTSLRWSSPTLPGTGTYCVYLDAKGEVIWLYETAVPLRDVIRLRNGNVIVNASNRLAQEIDPFGNIVTQWWAARLGTSGAPAGAVLVDCDSFHHELHELPDTDAGDFIALSTELRVYPNYPTSEVDTTQTAPTANVVGDVVVEFKRDGTLVRECKLLDVIDPYRICYGSLANVYNPLYNNLPTFDWSHGNAADVDVTDDTWIISLRHQDAVLKVRRSDNSLVWIHGPHGRWVAPWSQYLLTPIGSGFEWNFHEHSPHMSADGTLQMFDNGNYRVIPPTTAPPVSAWYSRAVRYRIDPVAMTTEQLWDFRDTTPFFSGQLGDADPLLVTGNVLIADGAKNVTTSNKQFSRIVEVTGTTPAEKVFEVIVNDPLLPGSNPFNWNVYRAQRYPSVYPF